MNYESHLRLGLVGAVMLTGCAAEAMHVNLFTNGDIAQSVTPYLELACADASLPFDTDACVGSQLTLLDAYQTDSRPELIIVFPTHLNIDGGLDQFNDSPTITRLSAELPESELRSPAVSHRGLSNDEGASIRFDDYTDKVLSGQIRGTLRERVVEVHDSKDPECLTDDMQGICYRSESMDRELMIDFRLLVALQRSL